GDATRAMGTPRNVEYQVFSQVTGRLNRASTEGRPFSELAMALHENLRLWTIIAIDVTSAENGLPVPLRAQLADLSKFTRSHTLKVLRQEADPGVLIEINTAVMRGLRGQLPPQEA
ncbi:MAG: flagellar biosynthesis regulator FlaF, partial [Paracoccaceae bacterium]